MGRKSRGKDKPRLQKYDMELGDKIINMKRLAHDVFAYAVKKFNLPEACICACKIEENDYPHSDFIEVISRMIIRLQITFRNMWLEQFKSHYESTNFSSFDDIIRVLQEVLRNKNLNDRDLVLYKFTAYMAVICELVLFLFTADCKLYFEELTKFWADYVNYDKHRFVKYGGFVGVYWSYSSPAFAKLDIFFNRIIPKYCIPYKESSTLTQMYLVKEKKFLTKAGAAFYQQEFSFLHTSFINNLLEMAGASEPEPETASGTDPLQNPLLGIRPHEVLQSEIGQSIEDTDAPTQNLPNPTSNETARNRRSLRMERLRRKPSLRTAMKDVEELSTGLPGTSTTFSLQNLPSTSFQEKVRDRKELSGQKDTKQKSASYLSGEQTENLYIGLIGAEAAITPQNISTASCQEEARDPKRHKQENSDSDSSVEKQLEKLNLGFPKKTLDEKDKLKEYQ